MWNRHVLYPDPEQILISVCQQKGGRQADRQTDRRAGLSVLWESENRKVSKKIYSILKKIGYVC